MEFIASFFALLAAFFAAPSAQTLDFNALTLHKVPEARVVILFFHTSTRSCASTISSSPISKVPSPSVAL